jgi:cytochrome c oxidase assembly protein Cox11
MHSDNVQPTYFNKNSHAVMSINHSTFEENFNAFSLYVSSHPLLADQGERFTADEASAQRAVVFPKAIAVQYHSKIHKQLLWPLKVAQQQVRAA